MRTEEKKFTNERDADSLKLVWDFCASHQTCDTQADAADLSLACIQKGCVSTDTECGSGGDYVLEKNTKQSFGMVSDKIWYPPIFSQGFQKTLETLKQTWCLSVSLPPHMF